MLNADCWYSFLERYSLFEHFSFWFFFVRIFVVVVVIMDNFWINNLSNFLAIEFSSIPSPASVRLLCFDGLGSSQILVLMCICFEWHLFYLKLIITIPLVVRLVRRRFDHWMRKTWRTGPMLMSNERNNDNSWICCKQTNLSKTK